jgi:hypothetical protein
MSIHKLALILKGSIFVSEVPIALNEKSGKLNT